MENDQKPSSKLSSQHSMKPACRMLTTDEINSCRFDPPAGAIVLRSLDADGLQRKFAKVNNLQLLDSDEYAAHQAAMVRAASDTTMLVAALRELQAMPGIGPRALAVIREALDSHASKGDQL